MLSAGWLGSPNPGTQSRRHGGNGPHPSCSPAERSCQIPLASCTPRHRYFTPGSGPRGAEPAARPSAGTTRGEGGTTCFPNSLQTPWGFVLPVPSPPRKQAGRRACTTGEPPPDGTDPQPAPPSQDGSCHQHGSRQGEDKIKIKMKNLSALLNERFKALITYFSRQAGVEQIKGCRISA